jgi:hypothetical protein
MWPAALNIDNKTAKKALTVLVNEGTLEFTSFGGATFIKLPEPSLGIHWRSICPLIELQGMQSKLTKMALSKSQILGVRSAGCSHR